LARKEVSGLVNRKGVWHIEKRWRGRRLRESCGTSDIYEAERYLIHRLEELRRAEIYGVRPRRTFRDAATRYLGEATKRTLRDDARQLKMLDPYIGDLQLEAVHMGSLHLFMRDRRKQGRRNRTVNSALQVVRRILNLAAGEWIDEHGMTWLSRPPKIKLLRESDKKPPYPLSWDEQFRLFNELPDHLAKMSLFAVNTGCRAREICNLRWDMEIPVPELNTSVFIIPGRIVKNSEDRLVVLNRLARAVVQEMRGKHATHVFSYRGKPVRNMYDTAWKSGRLRAGLPDVRVHDLKHTFGRRLRAAGVSFEDRQDLLGHKSTRITTHYSQAELENLIEAANSVCGETVNRTPPLVILKRTLRVVGE